MAICGNGQYPFIYRWFSKFVSPFSWGISHWHVWSGLPRVAGQWCILRCTLRTFGSATSPLWPLCWGFFSDDLSRGAWNQIAFPRRMVISHSLLHIESYFNLFQSISIIFQSYFNHISIIFQSYFNLFQSISIYFNLFHMMLLQCVLRFYLLTPMLRSSWVLDFRPERVQFVKVQDQKVAKFKMGRSVMISPSSPSSISSVSQISIHVATDHGVYSPWVNSGHFGEKRVPGPRSRRAGTDCRPGALLFLHQLDHRLHVAAAEHESGQVKAAPGRRMVSSRVQEPWMVARCNKM